MGEDQVLFSSVNENVEGEGEPPYTPFKDSTFLRQ